MTDRPAVKMFSVYNARGIREGAVEFLYELLKERTSEVNISHAEIPALQQHRQFVYRKPYQHWVLMAVEGRYVGTVYATDRNEIGVQILRAFHRQGLARAGLRSFFDNHKPLPAVPSMRRGEWVANIAPGNAASIALFAHFGARHIQQTYALAP